MDVPLTLPELPQILVDLRAVCPDVVSISEFGRGPQGIPGRRFDVRDAYASTQDGVAHRIGDYRFHYVLSQLGENGPFDLQPWTLRQLQDLAQVLVREASWVWRLSALESASLRSRAEVGRWEDEDTFVVLGEATGDAECVALLAAFVDAKRGGA